MNKSLLLTLAATLAGCAQLPRPQPGVAFDGAGYPVEVCDAAYAGRAARCELSGSGTAQRFKGMVLSDGKLLVGGEIRIEADGRISAVACRVPTEQAVSIDCPGAVISAGFINLHEHIDYSYQQPPQAPTLRWDHRHQWRQLAASARGFEGDAPKDETVRTEVSERAMLRHLLGGTTALSGAKDYRAFTRNLKLADGALGVPAGLPVIDNTFPLNDGRTYATPTAPCNAEQAGAVKFNPANPFVPHVGEGVNPGARFEVDCLLDALQSKTTPNAFIHGVAISEAQIERLKQQNVAVVLSPRSNLELYGATAPIPALRRAGVTLALGTDWSPSGSLSMFDEMRCMARYNQQNLNGLLSWADIHRMATAGGADAVGLKGRIGRLLPGENADLVLIDSQGANSLARVLEGAALRETLAVFIGGRAAMFPTDWDSRLTAKQERCETDPRQLCGQSRVVCGANPQRPLARLLAQATYSIDDARLCRPAPTDDCVPQRPGQYDGQPRPDDRDGDGVKDAEDNCPALFNPPRPDENGRQPTMQGVAGCQTRG
ncbi:amidohydrolase family protein [Chitinimonas lacunae]|uniref:Amidohydrolase family protein n=1 Tax=Chitinimonas lacunae TaxID=1963018 RepID=A0ABV8MTR5_9NEIS